MPPSEAARSVQGSCPRLVLPYIGQAPAYLTDLCRPSLSARSTRHLRSAEQGLLHVHLLAPPPYRAGPSPWLALWYGMVFHWLSCHFLEYSPRNSFSNLKQHFMMMMMMMTTTTTMMMTMMRLLMMMVTMMTMTMTMTMIMMMIMTTTIMMIMKTLTMMMVLTTVTTVIMAS